MPWLIQIRGRPCRPGAARKPGEKARTASARSPLTTPRDSAYEPPSEKPASATRLTGSRPRTSVSAASRTATSRPSPPAIRSQVEAVEVGASTATPRAVAGSPTARREFAAEPPAPWKKTSRADGSPGGTASSTSAPGPRSSCIVPGAGRGSVGSAAGRASRRPSAAREEAGTSRSYPRAGGLHGGGQGEAMAETIPDSMLAGRLNVRTRDFAVTEVPVPTPGPGEVLVRVRAAGICLSDVHLIEGQLSPLFLPGDTVTLGHEVAGTVAALGPGVPGWTVDQRVLLQAGEERNGAVYTRGVDYDGGWAQYAVARADTLVAVPDDLPLEQRRCAAWPPAAGWCWSG